MVGTPQGWDEGAESLGAYFSRFLLAVDYAPGFEGRAARVDPTTRYAAFLVDTMARFRSSPALRAEHLHPWALLQAEEHRLRAQHPVEWAVGEAFCRELTEAPNAIGQRRTIGTI